MILSKTKLTIVLAALVLVGCIIATCLGHNSWIKTVGTVAAGFLFGTAVLIKK